MALSNHIDFPAIFSSGCPDLAVLSWPYIDARARNYERKDQWSQMYVREKSRSAKKSAKNLGARKKSAKIQGARERESANAKAQNLRPKKERESASAKSSAKERESASAKRKKKHVPSSENYLFEKKILRLGYKHLTRKKDLWNISALFQKQKILSMAKNGTPQSVNFLYVGRGGRRRFFRAFALASAKRK